eukprot:345327-Pyramimonas_sp.AAC.1
MVHLAALMVAPVLLPMMLGAPVLMGRPLNQATLLAALELGQIWGFRPSMWPSSLIAVLAAIA